MAPVPPNELPLLKNWIVQTLGGYNNLDSDLDILSDYTVALLEHDLPFDALRKQCTDQLQEFLADNASDFVEKLLNAVNTKPYMSQGPPQAPAAQPEQEFASRIDTNMDGGYDPANQQQNFGNNNGNFGRHNNNGNNRGHNNHNNNNNRNPNFRNGPRNFNFNAPNFNPANFNNANFTPDFANNGGFNNQQQQPWGNNNPNFNNNGFQNQGFQQNQRQPFNKFNQHQHYKKNLSDIATTQPDTEFTKKKLVVEKLPDDKFNETSLREYFSQFGNVVSIKLDNDNHLAELEYSTHNEARNAWSSPAPIFDNRFVKVYWRRKEENEDSSKDSIDVEAVKQVQADKQKQWEEKQAKKLENDKKLKEILSKQIELLQLQKDQQLLLIKHDEDSGKTEEAAAKRAVLTTLEVKLEALKREVNSTSTASSGPSTSAAPPYGSYRGGYRGRARGRGSYGTPYSPYGRPYRGRGGFQAASYSRDLRPKTVTVAPIPSDREEALRGYLMSVGEYEQADRVADKPDTVSITFKDRRTAETFFYGPRELPDVGKVDVAWVNTPAPAASATPSGHQSATGEQASAGMTDIKMEE
ncbi:hypothetical protein DV454_004465 [Geotrichum candidum]|nr:hypothetical protein DV454_004465 [Geotrichum candidum]